MGIAFASGQSTADIFRLEVGRIEGRFTQVKHTAPALDGAEVAQTTPAEVCTVSGEESRRTNPSIPLGIAQGELRQAMKPKGVARLIEGGLHHFGRITSCYGIGLAQGFGSTGMSKESLHIANAGAKTQRCRREVHSIEVDQHKGVLFARAFIYIGDIPRRKVFVYDTAIVKSGEEVGQGTGKWLIDLPRTRLVLQGISSKLDIARDVVAIFEPTPSVALLDIADGLRRPKLIGRDLQGIQE